MQIANLGMDDEIATEPWSRWGGAFDEITLERWAALKRVVRTCDAGSDACVFLLELILKGELPEATPSPSSLEVDEATVALLRETVLTEEMFDGEDEELEEVLTKRLCLDAIGPRWLALFQVIEQGLDEDDTSPLTMESAGEQLVALTHVVLWLGGCC